MSKHNNNKDSISRNKNKAGKNSVSLKGFFKWGENYVPHLSKKSKILSRFLEEINTKKNTKD